jgi:uncharacterized protein (TIGR02453 family)
MKPKFTTRKNAPKFSNKTLQFILKAARQKKPEWLDRNRDEYEEVLLEPLQNMAKFLKAELSPLAPGYHFPQKGIGRIRRPAHRMAENGGKAYRDWLTYTAARPREMRFTHNPNLFFLIQPTDLEDSVLVAGGLYMPTSQQTRAIREAIANNAAPFEQLFKSKAFANSFPEGFSDERCSSRIPKGFEPNHPKMKWIQLQAFFVWKSYSKKEFASPDFPKIVARDWRQILRLNELLDQAIQGRWIKTALQKPKRAELIDRLSEVGEARPEMDF